MQKYCWLDRSANVSDTPTPTWEQKLPMSMAGTAESGEGAEVADGEKVVGAPAIVLQLDENFCMGLYISSPNLRLCPPSRILHVLEEIGCPIGCAQFTREFRHFAADCWNRLCLGLICPSAWTQMLAMQLICSATISFEFLFLASHRLGLIA